MRRRQPNPTTTKREDRLRAAMATDDWDDLVEHFRGLGFRVDPVMLIDYEVRMTRPRAAQFTAHVCCGGCGELLEKLGPADEGDRFCESRFDEGFGTLAPRAARPSKRRERTGSLPPIEPRPGEDSLPANLNYPTRRSYDCRGCPRTFVFRTEKLTWAYFETFYTGSGILAWPDRLDVRGSGDLGLQGQRDELLRAVETGALVREVRRRGYVVEKSSTR
jgi:hypothetical protein